MDELARLLSARHMVRRYTDEPVTEDVLEQLLDLARRPYPEAIAAMWAVEAAYLTSWQGALPGAPAYAEFVTHWANDEFAAFVAQLGRVVDRELPDGPTPAAQAAVDEVVAHEAAFWGMTVEG